jgi:hypothetical protein
VEVARKLVPLIVRTCDAEPAGSEVGENDEMPGIGLFGTFTCWPPERVPELVTKLYVGALIALVNGDKV